MNNHAGATGFTLVEVLVALLIMAVMSGMAWQGIDGIVRARDASQARLETTLRLNTVMAQWDRDLASVQDTQAVPRALACTGNGVRVTRKTPTGVQIVAWTFRPGADDTMTLERWAGPAVTTNAELGESWLRSQQLQGGEPGSIKTITGLSSWKLYFNKNANWGNCGSSLGADGINDSPNIPDGVRLVLTFAPGSGLSGDLTRDSLITP